MKMESVYCNRIKIGKKNNVVLSIRKAGAVNFKNYHFTKHLLKKNPSLGFFDILQELMRKIFTGEIQGIYNEKDKANLSLVLYNIVMKQEYEQYQGYLPLDIIQKEWELIATLKDDKNKIYVLKNKYNNFFVDFKGNPSFISRITTIYNTSNVEIAMKLSYLEMLAVSSIFNMFPSEYRCINLTVSELQTA